VSSEPRTPDPLVAAFGHVARRFRDLRAAAGLVLLAGGAAAALGIVGFAWVAARVVSGRTQAFDDAALALVGRHRIPWLESTMLEVTLLGTGIVVMAIAAIAGVFLALTRHRASATLLLASTVGAIALNSVLKAAFDRPRPRVFEWQTHVVTTSFPSGHAMSAAAVYATVAFLVARLQARRSARLATILAAVLVTAAIGFSRIYLGVHYPSDVAAGIIVGWAWAAFCAVTLEAVQLYVRRERRRRRGRGTPGAEDVVDAAPAPAAQAAGPTS
jgi:undecaprenyl-diphosphatase